MYVRINYISDEILNCIKNNNKITLLICDYDVCIYDTLFIKLVETVNLCWNIAIWQLPRNLNDFHILELCRLTRDIQLTS